VESHAQEGKDREKVKEGKGRKEVSKSQGSMSSANHLSQVPDQYGELLRDSKRNTHPTPFVFLLIGKKIEGGLGWGGGITRFCNYISDRFDC